MIRITKNSIENFARGDMISKAYEKVLSNPELLPLFMARYGNRFKKFSPQNLSDDLAWSTSNFDKLDGANLIKKAESDSRIRDLIEKSKNKPTKSKNKPAKSDTNKEKTFFEKIKDPGINFRVGDTPITPLSAKIGSRNKNLKGGNVDVDNASRGLFEQDFVEIPNFFTKEYSEALKEILEQSNINPQVAEQVASQIKSRYVKGSSPLMKHLIRNNKIIRQPLFEQAQLVGSPWEIYPVETSIAALGGAGAVGLGAYNITKEK